ncbi:MAG: rhodanese-like domain-containing protein [SAR324 cluster bacterium]|nr:rhodanese-like domain-containing protein [SAR324 cluster bacterium]
MRNRISVLTILLLISSGLIGGSPVFAKGEKARILKPCTQCHEVDENQVRGRLEAKSNKAKTMRVFVGNGSWLVNFDKNTKVIGAKSVAKIKKNNEVLVSYVAKDKVLVATSVEVKPAADIPAKWILNVEQMKQLVAQGPEKGNFSLFDARPGKLFPEAHIKGAVSNYDGMFDKNIAKLPKDKNRLLVFYCGGPT